MSVSGRRPLVFTLRLKISFCDSFCLRVKHHGDLLKTSRLAIVNILSTQTCFETTFILQTLILPGNYVLYIYTRNLGHFWCKYLTQYIHVDVSLYNALLVRAVILLSSLRYVRCSETSKGIGFGGVSIGVCPPPGRLPSII